MENYLELINMMSYPTDFDVTLAYMWINPVHLPKKLLSLGNSDSSWFYKMPEWYTNYTFLSGAPLPKPVSVPIVSFASDLFKDNKDITDLILGRNVAGLPIGAFSGMSNLKRIYIPKSVKYIPKNCFLGCISLEEVYYEGSEENFNKMEIFYKQYKVIPKLGLYDDIEVYYDNGNLPFINAKVHYNVIQEPKSVSTYNLERKELEIMLKV